MTYVTLREGESQEQLIRRFRAVVERSGILRQAKEKRHFISKQEKARIKARKARRRRS
ncbi:MAG: 30S ribosomal protein S21 [Chloroflexi bacterium]|nr:30S ribosomal protein S21 [Chloroflexota bacterium]